MGRKKKCENLELIVDSQNDPNAIDICPAAQEGVNDDCGAFRSQDGEVVDISVEEAEKIVKKSMSFMTKAVIFSFTFVVLYTIWTQVGMVLFNIYPNDMVTDKVYQFFGLEICLLMFKRVFNGAFDAIFGKIRKRYIIEVSTNNSCDTFCGM